MSAAPERVVVVGASGFVGRNLVCRLAELGVEVVGVNRSGATVPGCLQTLALDQIASAAPLPPDAVVVHVAAHRYDAASFALAQSETLLGNAALAPAVYHFCAQRGLTEVRMASSQAVYPAAADTLDDERPIDLNAPPHAGESGYAWSKRWAEVCADVYHDRHGVNTQTFRLTNPYGPFDSLDEQQAHVVPAFVIRALGDAPSFQIRGNADAERDFVYVGDVVDVFARSLARHGEHDAYNLAFGETVTIRCLAEQVLAAAGVDRPIVAQPASGGVALRRPTAAKLRRAYCLGPFTPLGLGLRHTVAWYRQALAGRN